MSAIAALRDLFRRERLLAVQTRELAEMREELAKQRDQNERMRAGMRRCVTCDYRQAGIGQTADEESGR